MIVFTEVFGHTDSRTRLVEYLHSQTQINILAADSLCYSYSLFSVTHAEYLHLADAFI